MTGTEQPSATPAEASADHQKTIRVKAYAAALFDALTSVSGPAAWWTRVTGSGGAGGELTSSDRAGLGIFNAPPEDETVSA